LSLLESFGLGEPISGLVLAGAASLASASSAVVFALLVQPASRLLFLPAVRPDAAGAGAARAALLGSRIGKAGRGGARILLAVSLCLWGLAAIVAPPNVRNAFERGRQKRTEGNMRTIITAVESYAVDHKDFPEAASIHELAALLEPTYTRKLPRTDAWGRPMRYRRVDALHFGVWSAGSDGEFEHDDPTAYTGGPIETFDRDLVFCTGGSGQYPDGEMGW